MPANAELINRNDTFFKGCSIIPDDLTKEVLKGIDTGLYSIAFDEDKLEVYPSIR